MSSKNYLALTGACWHRVLSSRWQRTGSVSQTFKWKRILGGWSQAHGCDIHRGGSGGWKRSRVERYTCTWVCSNTSDHDIGTIGTVDRYGRFIVSGSNKHQSYRWNSWNIIKIKDIPPIFKSTNQMNSWNYATKLNFKKWLRSKAQLNCRTFYPPGLLTKETLTTSKIHWKFSWSGKIL